MSSVDVVWGTAAVSSATVALLFFAVWARTPRAWPHLLFSVAALAVAAHGLLALRLMHAETIAQAGSAQRLLQVPTFVIVVSMVWFVHLYLRAGRRSLAWAVTALRALALGLNALPGTNLIFKEVTGLQQVAVFGSPVSLPVGVPNRWALVAQLSSLVFLVFVLDAARGVWRRGDRRHVVSICGTVAFGIVAATLFGAPNMTGGVVGPPIMALVFLPLLLIIGGELSGEVAAAERVLRRSQASEQQRRHAVEEAHDRLFDLPLHLAWILTADGVVERMNGATRALLGPDRDPVGRPFVECVHPDDVAAVERYFSSLDAPERVAGGDIRVRCHDDSWRIVAWSATRLRDGHIYGSGSDQTSERETARALRDSEERHRLLLQSSRDAIMTLSPPVWRFDSCNQATLDLFGVADEATLRSLGPWDLSPERQPDGSLSADLAKDMIDTAMREGGHAFEWMHRRLNGDAFAATVLLSRVEQHGGAFLQASVRDVSAERAAEAALLEMNQSLENAVLARTRELRSSEERLRAVVESLSEGLLLTDLEDVVVDVNPRMLEMTGYAREELIGRPATEVLVPEAERAGVRRRNEMRARGIEQRYEQRLLRKDGSEFVALVAGAPLRDGRGRTIGTVVVNLDITDRKEAERVSLRAQRLESIGTLAGGIAHDLNNALNPIVLALQLLRDESPESASVLDLCESSATRATEMVRQLLGFAKGAGGARARVDVMTAVEEIHRLVAATFPKNVEVDVTGLEPMCVVGDATQIHQILLNLCVNARDAMPAGGRLTIGVTRVVVTDGVAEGLPELSPGPHVALTVRDTGTGMPPEVLDRIFEPFFTTKGPERGTGLGLATVVGILKGHRGALRVTSAVGQGTTFTVYLPEAEPNREDAPEHQPAVEWHPAGELVLVVDDDATIRAMARMILERNRLRVVTASDGAEGEQVVARHKGELAAVITDMNMPGVDGLAFARRMRVLMPDVPLALASGRLQAHDRVELESLGVRALLPKPFNEGQLIRVMHELMAPVGSLRA